MKSNVRPKKKAERNAKALVSALATGAPEIALDACRARAAYERADAWARSAPGTPYGRAR
jgi:hypothetical protein